MPTAPGSAARRRLLLWTERLLMACGAASLAWVGWVIADGELAQRRARHDLLLRATPPSAIVSAPVRHAPVRHVGAALGELSIPRVHLSAMVLHGSDPRTLRRGPGHIENTALPGQPGNVAVAGHRDSFFRPIRHVRVGDDVFFETGERRLHYRVSWTGVIDPRDVSVLEDTGEPTLTLITCYPFWVAGPAPDRFVVRADEVPERE